MLELLGLPSGRSGSLVQLRRPTHAVAHRFRKEHVLDALGNLALLLPVLALPGTATRASKAALKPGPQSAESLFRTQASSLICLVCERRLGPPLGRLFHFVVASNEASALQHSFLPERPSFLADLLRGSQPARCRHARRNGRQGKVVPLRPAFPAQRARRLRAPK